MPTRTLQNKIFGILYVHIYYFGEREREGGREKEGGKEGGRERANILRFLPLQNSLASFIRYVSNAVR